MSTIHNTLARASHKVTLRKDLRFQVREDSSYVIIEDPACGKFHRLGLAEYRFLLGLENSNAIQPASKPSDPRQPNESAGDEAPPLTQRQVEALCRWLVDNGLAENTNNGSQPKPKGEPVWSTFNPFFFRRSLLNPDRLLTKLAPLQLLFTWPCYLALACFALYTLGLVWSSVDEFAASYQDIFATHRVAAMIGMWILLKIVHELAHGIVCKRYGGRIPDAGVAFMLFTPIAYIDVTSSWRFASRWQRVHVASAGIIIEFLVAAIAAFVWMDAESAFIKQCAADLIMMATVNSLLFNMNPLMRFDGYFILADLLKIDNLYQSGRAYARYWSQRYLLGLSVSCPRLLSKWPAVTKFYGLAAAFWRIVVVYGLLVAAAAMFHGGGIVIAALGVVVWIIVPTIRLVRSLVLAGRRGQISFGNVLGRSMIAAMVVVTILFLTPIEFPPTAPGIVEYAPPTVVRAQSDGFVAYIHVRDGQIVREGAPIITLRNEQLKLDLSEVETSLALARHRARSGQWNHDSSEFKQSQCAVEGLQKQRQEIEEQIRQLTVRSPSNGKVIARRIEELKETYLEKGTKIACIGVEELKRLKFSVHPTNLYDLNLDLNSEVNVWTSTAAWRATLTRIDPRATCERPHESLCSTGGGSLTVERDDSGELFLTEPRVNAYIELDRQTSSRLFAGERVATALRTSPRTVGNWLFSLLVQVDAKPAESGD